VSLQQTIQDAVGAGFAGLGDLARSSTLKRDDGTGTRVDGVYTPSFTEETCTTILGNFKKHEENSQVRPGEIKLTIQAKGMTLTPSPADVIEIDSQEYHLVSVWQVPKVGAPAVYIATVKTGGPA
jgi:hypothetical protein